MAPFFVTTVRDLGMSINEEADRRDFPDRNPRLANVEYDTGHKPVWIKFHVEEMLRRGVVLYQIVSTGAIVTADPVPIECIIKVLYNGSDVETATYSNDDLERRLVDNQKQAKRGQESHDVAEPYEQPLITHDSEQATLENVRQSINENIATSSAEIRTATLKLEETKQKLPG